MSRLCTKSTVWSVTCDIILLASQTFFLVTFSASVFFVLDMLLLIWCLLIIVYILSSVQCAVTRDFY